MEREYLITSTDAQLARHYRARANHAPSKNEFPRIQPPALPTPQTRPRSTPRSPPNPLGPFLARVPEPSGGVTVLARSAVVVSPSPEVFWHQTHRAKSSKAARFPRETSSDSRKVANFESAPREHQKTWPARPRDARSRPGTAGIECSPESFASPAFSGAFPSLRPRPSPADHFLGAQRALRGGERAQERQLGQFMTRSFAGEPGRDFDRFRVSAVEQPELDL